MNDGRSYRFLNAITRQPGNSIAAALRAADSGDPDAGKFRQEHELYVDALRDGGVDVVVLDALEQFPDSVFIEDAALCVADTAIVLRPGAPSRFGEAAALQPELQSHFQQVITLPGDGHVDGGDVLLSDTHAFIGLSARTDKTGLTALAGVLEDFSYKLREVNTPPDILHFKTDCGLLDAETVFATAALTATHCFAGYRVIEAPESEAAAANLVRINDVVLLSKGYPRTHELLDGAGYRVVVVPTHEAAKVDGGLSCMSLRFSWDA